MVAMKVIKRRKQRQIQQATEKVYEMEILK